MPFGNTLLGYLNVFYLTMNKNNLLKTSIELGFIIYDTLGGASPWVKITHEDFEEVKIFKENGVMIFVTDEPDFIRILKELGIHGKQRSTHAQRKRENGRK